MAGLKLKKLPKKPKTTASVTTIQNYLKRVDSIKRENQRIKKENDKRLSLVKKMQSIR